MTLYYLQHWTVLREVPLKLFNVGDREELIVIGGVCDILFSDWVCWWSDLIESPKANNGLLQPRLQHDDDDDDDDEHEFISTPQPLWLFTAIPAPNITDRTYLLTYFNKLFWSAFAIKMILTVKLLISFMNAMELTLYADCVSD